MTIIRTYHSNIMQISDCNVLATFQCLMTSIFRDVIGKWMHVYLDNIFVFSDSTEEHKQHLRIVLKDYKKTSSTSNIRNVMVINAVLGHYWDGKNLEFKVHWSLRDTTWESLATCKDLAALNRYLELQGMQHPAQLARRSMLT
ncbi:hypothetical protein J132_07377 [Termitomyces sp. J132]|nr:hypothetical protein J132_07377 [Termitomyces sp. J132]